MSSAGTITNLDRRPRSSKNRATGETLRPVDRCHRLYFKSSIVCLWCTHSHMFFSRYRVWSHPADQWRSPDPRTLTAVNDTSIRTFGQRSLTLNLSLRRSFPWIFIVADLQKPILGADFLRHYGLHYGLMVWYAQAYSCWHQHTHSGTRHFLLWCFALLLHLLKKPPFKKTPYPILLADFPALTQTFTWFTCQARSLPLSVATLFWVISVFDSN